MIAQLLVRITCRPFIATSQMVPVIESLKAEMDTNSQVGLGDILDHVTFQEILLLGTRVLPEQLTCPLTIYC